MLAKGSAVPNADDRWVEEVQACFEAAASAGRLCRIKDAVYERAEARWGVSSMLWLIPSACEDYLRQRQTEGIVPILFLAPLDRLYTALRTFLREELREARAAGFGGLKCVEAALRHFPALAEDPGRPHLRAGSSSELVANWLIPSLEDIRTVEARLRILMESGDLPALAEHALELYRAGVKDTDDDDGLDPHRILLDHTEALDACYFGTRASDPREPVVIVVNLREEWAFDLFRRNYGPDAARRHVDKVQSGPAWAVMPFPEEIAASTVAALVDDSARKALLRCREPGFYRAVLLSVGKCHMIRRAAMT